MKKSRQRQSAAGKESESGQEQGQEPLDLSEAEREIDKLGGEFRKIRDKQKEVQEEILRLQELRRQMPDEGGRSAGRSGSGSSGRAGAKDGVKDRAGGRSGAGAGGPVLAKGSHAYITVHTGVLPKENRAAFEKEIAKLPSVYLPEQGSAAAEGAASSRVLPEVASRSISSLPLSATTAG
ncbi:MAG: hypothetical protein U5P10_01055 [Spirochaetia bacterium]|nr:hypothetical protein [Spirochaetia bacterium]